MDQFIETLEKETNLLSVVEVISFKSDKVFEYYKNSPISFRNKYAKVVSFILDYHTNLDLIETGPDHCSTIYKFIKLRGLNFSERDRQTVISVLGQSSLPNREEELKEIFRINLVNEDMKGYDLKFFYLYKAKTEHVRVIASNIDEYLNTDVAKCIINQDHNLVGDFHQLFAKLAGI